MGVEPLSNSMNSIPSRHDDTSVENKSINTNASITTLSNEESQNQSLRSRVRNAVIRSWRQKQQQQQIRPRKIEVIEDVDEFQKIVSDEQQDAIAVMFYSPVCKACQAVKPLYNRLAQKYTQVKFISVPMTQANSKALKELGVQKFPFGHIYMPSKGLVNAAGLLRKKIPHFEANLRLVLSK